MAAGGGRESMLDVIVKQMKEENRVIAAKPESANKTYSISFCLSGAGDSLPHSGCQALSSCQ